MLNPLEREQLLRRWDEIERELDHIGNLPTGQVDPAEREQRLLEAQDVIECLFAWHFAAAESTDKPADRADSGSLDPNRSEAS